MQEYHIWFEVVNKKSGRVRYRDRFSWVEAKDIDKAREAGKKMEAEAMQLYEDEGWFNVTDDKLVMEVERVYATRYDCPIAPEGVRRAA